MQAAQQGMEKNNVYVMCARSCLLMHGMLEQPRAAWHLFIMIGLVTETQETNAALTTNTIKPLISYNVQ